jgi:hypothetical protein
MGVLLVLVAWLLGCLGLEYLPAFRRPPFVRLKFRAIQPRIGTFAWLCGLPQVKGRMEAIARRVDPKSGVPVPKSGSRAGFTIPGQSSQIFPDRFLPASELVNQRDDARGVWGFGF